MLYVRTAHTSLSVFLCVSCSCSCAVRPRHREVCHATESRESCVCFPPTSANPCVCGSMSNLVSTYEVQYCVVLQIDVLSARGDTRSFVHGQITFELLSTFERKECPSSDV